MLNVINIGVYGSDRSKILNDLMQFNPALLSREPDYNYSFIKSTFDKLFKMIGFLDEKKNTYNNLQYKLFYHSQLDYRFKEYRNPHLKNSPYYILYLHSTAIFNPCDLKEACSSYFTTDPNSQINVGKKSGKILMLLGFDLDGILYAHHSVASVIMNSGLPGLEFIRIYSSDNNLYSYYNRGKREDLLNIAKELVCELDEHHPMFYLTKDEAEQGKRERLLSSLYNLNRKHGDTERDARLIGEFTPPTDQNLTKWMAIDVEQIKGVEEIKGRFSLRKASVYTTKDRKCPITGKEFPLLTSQLYLIKKNIPEGLDFFRTDNNHLIISRKAYDFFEKESIAPVDVLCEPVILI